MPKKGKNGVRARSQRRRFDHSLHAHTRPGSVIVPHGAEAALIRVTAYGADQMVDKHNCAISQIRELRGAYPVTWIDATGLGDAKLIEDLGELLGLHRLSLEDLVNLPQRSKVEEYAGYLYAVTQIPSYNGDLATEQISVFMGAGFLLTWRERPGPCFDIVRKRLQVSRGVTRSAGVGYLFYAVLDAVIDSFFPVLEKLGDSLDELEDRVESVADASMIAPMRDIRNDVRQLRRVVWPLRDAVDNLTRDLNELVDEETRIHLRDCHDHTVQILDSLENYRDACGDLRDYYATAISNRMNEIMKVLTIISTLFMPLSFIAGVYGMNFDRSASRWNMPELGWPWGYAFSLALMGAIATVQMTFFWRRGWLGNAERRDKKPEKANGAK